MRLNEVITIPSQSSGNIDFSAFDGSVQFKTANVEHFPLLYKKIGDRFLFSLDFNTEKIAFVVADEIEDFTDKPTIRIVQTFVIPSFRNKGVMTAIYNTLYNQGFRVISDFMLSNQSISVWKALKRFGVDVKLFNRQTKNVEQLTKPLEDYDDENYLFVAEGKQYKSGTLQAVRNPDNSIVYEYQIFLDPTIFYNSDHSIREGFEFLNNLP